MVYQSGINQIDNLTTSQSKLQQEISTMKKILTPSDDPVGAASAVQVEQAQSLNTQYASNRSTVTSQLTNVESTLSNISNLIVSVQSTVVTAGNGTYSDSDRAALATQISNNISQMLGYANTTDASGNYIFAGNQNTTIPYQQTSTGATYSGDSGQNTVQVAAQRYMQVNYTGSQVFSANGNDIFTTLTNLATLLKTPVTNQASQTALTNGLASASASLSSALNNVSSIQAQVGSNLNEVDTLNTIGTSISTQNATTLSGLQDLDYAQALSDFSKNQTILQAAQQSFVQVTSLSLFNILKG
jgi:flagellar hook-associated protein 3 FlgL